jgi:hypothetical protein
MVLHANAPPNSPIERRGLSVGRHIQQQARNAISMLNSKRKISDAECEASIAAAVAPRIPVLLVPGERMPFPLHLTPHKRQ